MPAHLFRILTAHPTPAGHLAELVLDGAGGELSSAALTLWPRSAGWSPSGAGGTVGAGSLLGELKSAIGFSIGLVGRTRASRAQERFPVRVLKETDGTPKSHAETADVMPAAAGGERSHARARRSPRG